jgi:ABC-type amino acid transport system permease subunit
MESVCVLNEKCYHPNILCLAGCKSAWSWQQGLCNLEESSSRLEIGFVMLVVVTMKVTVFIFFVWQCEREHGTGTLFSLFWKKSSARLKVGFGILVVAIMKIAVLWDVVLCSLVEAYQCFRGSCCLHLVGRQGHHHLW